jgi:heme-degrading monooxygenase HmoA
MYIAMNRFQVLKEKAETFETIWRERESRLDKMPGFVDFHLLRGPEREDHILYASHTLWRSKSDFEGWTRSDAFRESHARAGGSNRGKVYLGHPEFEGFEVNQTLESRTVDHAAV